METNNFYNNGSFNDETMGLIKDGVYLAKRAYDNKDRLNDLSKPLNNIDTKNPLLSKDGYTIIENPETNTKFEVVRIFSDSNTGLDITTFRELGTSKYTFAFAGTDSFKDLEIDIKILKDKVNPQADLAVDHVKDEIEKYLKDDPNATFVNTSHSLGSTNSQIVAAKVEKIQVATNFNPFGAGGINNLSDEEIKRADGKVINFSTFGDPVTPINEQIGQSFLIKESASTLSLLALVNPTYYLTWIFGQHKIATARGAINKSKSGSDFVNVSGKGSVDVIEALKKAMSGGDKNYVNFVKIMKYFNEDGTVNFAKYLADTANISLYDPIALDLNANGKIDTLSLENGVFFDHNGDKIAFKSSWVNSSDGILARDIDGDGAITSGAELFGNFTKLKNGELAKNGAQALKDLDDNNDGIFDSNDKAFNEILVWQDKNSDGISQKNELKTLNEHNIKSIDLEFMADNTALDKDNKQILIGSFSTNISNESKNNLASDIDFSVDTIQRNILDDTDGIIKGTGFVRNFNLSLNDEIKNAYESYKTLNTKQQQLSNVETLVNLWAKTAKQYKELDNPIQKVKINISSVASNTTSSGINEAIKRAEAGEITLSDGVKISA